MLRLFKPPRRRPAAHRDVFAEFAMRLIGFIVERRLAGGREPQPRFRVVR
jgi:hypothetical protein